MREIYIHADEHPINRKGIRDSALRGCVNTSGKAGAQIPHLPLGDDSSPRGRQFSRRIILDGLHGCVLQVTHSHLSIQNIKLQVTNYL
jgi:hypothetical protein